MQEAALGQDNLQQFSVMKQDSWNRCVTDVRIVVGTLGTLGVKATSAPRLETFL